MKRTFQTHRQNIIQKFVWTLPYLIVVVGLFLSVMGLSEFYNVKIKGEVSAYAFGPVADNQWYYQNPSIYATYNLVSGLLYSTLTILIFWATIKRNSRLLFIGIFIMLFFLIAHFVSSGIQ